MGAREDALRRLGLLPPELADVIDSGVEKRKVGSSFQPSVGGTHAVSEQPESFVEEIPIKTTQKVRSLPRPLPKMSDVQRIGFLERGGFIPSGTTEKIETISTYIEKPQIGKPGGKPYTKTEVLIDIEREDKRNESRMNKIIDLYNSIDDTQWYYTDSSKRRMKQGIDIKNQVLLPIINQYKQNDVDIEKYKQGIKNLNYTQFYKTSYGYSVVPESEQYEKSPEYYGLQKEGILGLFATAWTPGDPLGLKSFYYMATGQKKEAIKTKVLAIRQVRGLSKEGLLGFGKFYISSPIGLLATTAVGAGAYGIASGYAGGYIGTRFGARALLTYKIGEISIGGGLLGLTAYDVYKKYEQKKYAEAFSSLFITPLQIGAGYVGYKSFRGIGWTRGARRGFRARIKTSMKKGTISYEMGNKYLEFERLEWKLRKNLGKIKIRSKPLEFQKIESLREATSFREFTRRHLLRRKSEVYGSVSEQRDLMHDIDVAYKNYTQGLIEMRYAQYKTTGTLPEDKFMVDIHKLAKSGTIVGRMGTQKMPSIRTPEGYNVMQIAESAMRHGESALELVHIGRLKDISRAYELYGKLLFKSGRADLLETYIKYGKLGSEIMQQPLMMGKEMQPMFKYSMSEYLTSLKARIKINLIPTSMLEKSFIKTMSIELPSLTKTTSTIISSKGLPPTPSQFYVSPSIISPGMFTSSYFKQISQTFFKPSPSYDYVQTLIGYRTYIPQKYSISPKLSSIFKTSMSKIGMSGYKTKVPSVSSSVKSISQSISSSIKQSLSPSVSPYYYSPSYQIPSPSLYPSPYPSISGYGSKGNVYDLWGRYYRKREFKLPSFLQLLGIKRR